MPVFYFSGRILHALGVARVLHLAMAAFVVRLVAYSLLELYPTLWLVLLVELLQGVTFAASWAAGLVHCRRIAPLHVQSTVQSIFAGLYSGFGAGVGGLVGGLVYGRWGGRVMAATGAVMVAAGWAAAAALGAGGAMAAVRRARRAAGGGRRPSEAPPPGAPAESV